MTLHLREATAEDDALCLSLLHAADEDDQHILATINAPAHSTYLAYDGETAVSAAVIRWDEYEAEITHLAVAETARGKGFGKQIVDALVAEARKRAMQAVLVGTANSSIGNMVFYQKCGFRMDHVRRDYFHYLTQPVLEDGIPIRDMLVFRLALR